MTQPCCLIVIYSHQGGKIVGRATVQHQKKWLQLCKLQNAIKTQHVFYSNTICIMPIFTFYFHGSNPSRVALIVNAHAMCPTLEFKYPCTTFRASDFYIPKVHKTKVEH